MRVKIVKESVIPEEFLNTPEIQELIKQNKIDTVYEQGINNGIDPKIISNALINLNINPLEYITTLFPYMFANTRIDIANIKCNTENIPNGIFYECHYLKKVIIPPTVQTISDSAFMHCSQLEEIIIPKSVKTIGDYAFYSCPSLKNVYYDGSEEDYKKIVFGEGNKDIKDIYFLDDNNKFRKSINWHYKNESLTEALKPRDSSEKLITLLVRDPDKQLENLLEYIKVNASSGHSFPVEVDPHDSEKKESFYIDGDGSCSILEMEVIQGDDVEEEL